MMTSVIVDYRGMNHETAIEYKWVLRDIEAEQVEIPHLIREDKEQGMTYDETLEDLRTALVLDMNDCVESDYIRELLGCLDIDFHAIAERLMENYWN